MFGDKVTSMKGKVAWRDYFFCVGFWRIINGEVFYLQACGKVPEARACWGARSPFTMTAASPYRLPERPPIMPTSMPWTVGAAA
jgi:hypothetical protein